MIGLAARTTNASDVQGVTRKSHLRVWVVAMLMMLTVVGGAPAAPANPVTLPVAADPTIIRGANGMYYMYATADDWGDGFGMRRMTMWSSFDLTDWMYIGNVFNNNPSWVTSGFLWAPHIVQSGDLYFLYYSVGGTNNPCIGRATATNPAGPWTDLGRAVFCSNNVGIGGTIDPFVFIHDGSVNVAVGNFQGVYIVPLNAAGTAPSGATPVRIADNRFEAPEIYFRDGYYYLFVSAGNCCSGPVSAYRVLVGRSTSINGPYLDRKGTDLNQKGGALILAGDDRWAGPGHSTLITDENGTDWLAYHAIPRNDPYMASGVNRRPAMIDKVVWANGWPEVGDGSPTSTRPELPAINLPVQVSITPNGNTSFTRGGGTFTATLRVQAPATQGYSGQVWAIRAQPNNAQTNILGPINVNLAPGQVYQQTLSYRMTLSAPRGFYRFYGYAGTFGANAVELGTATFYKSSNNTAINIAAEELASLGIDEATYAAMVDAGIDPQNPEAPVATEGAETPAAPAE